MDSMLGLYLCSAAIFFLFIALIAWLIRRGWAYERSLQQAPPAPRAGTPASEATVAPVVGAETPHPEAAVAAPAPGLGRSSRAQAGDLPSFVAFDRLIVRWAAEGLLAPELATQVRDLIAIEWEVVAGARASQPLAAPGSAALAPAAGVRASQPLAAPGGAALAPVAAPSPAPGSVASAAAAIGAASASVAPVAAAIVPTASDLTHPAGRAGDAPTGPAAPARQAGATPSTSAAPAGATAARPPEPAEPPEAPPAPRVSRPSLGAALLALGTRRTLLFLGTFLLLMSSLTLVVFSWASLAPGVQLAILAGTTGAIWAGGALMARKPDLATAGRNLQAVAALLMPVVGFALGRPGLLDLAPRPAWQLASGLSLAAYLLAAQRTRMPLYSGAAALAAASLLLASLGALSAGWQLVPVVALMGALLPIAGALRGAGEGRLAEGPRWVALVGGPLVLLAATLLYITTGSYRFVAAEGGYPFAAALAIGALFCGLAYRHERRVGWLWAVVALPPAALFVALLQAAAALELQALALALLALVYLGLCAGLEGRHAPALRPLFVGALGLGLLALPAVAVDAAAVRLALPPLISFGLAAMLLVERGRLAWLGARRHWFATGGLGAAALLLFAWLWAMVGLLPLADTTIGLLVLPLAGLYFAGSGLWPGRLRASYDQALQALAVLVVVVAGGTTLVDPATRLAGALLVALIVGGQAAARRLWPWAAVSLVALAGAAAFAVERFAAPADQLRMLTLAALALAALYSLGGERLRRTALAYWSWPGVALGVLAGLCAGAGALAQVAVAPGLFSGALLGLAALLGLHTALWRRSALGFAAAPLLVGAALVAAGEGFFVGWAPARGDLAYVLCALALALVALGQGLRRFGRAYGLPYELTAFVALPAAPLLAGFDPAHLALTWAAMAGLYAAALWRYRLPWLLALAFVALDMALVHGVAWLLPGGDPAGAGLILAAAAAAQALFSAWARRRPAPLGDAGLWGYLSAAIGGLGALALAVGSAGHGAAVAGMLAAALAALVWIERREAPAWAALGLLALSLSQLHRLYGLTVEGALLATGLEALAVYVGGWGVQGLASGLPRLAPWRRPLAYGAGATAVALPLLLALVSLTGDAALLGVALLLAGLAVGLVGWRQRTQAAAGVALALWTVALLCELPARNPGTWAQLGPYLLLGLAWLMGAASLLGRLAPLGRPAAPQLRGSVYGAAALAGALALWATGGAQGTLALVCLGLAALLALAATGERREAVAWASLGLALAGAWLWHRELGLTAAWAGAWLTLELVGVSLAGWLAARLGLGLWRRPTTLGAVGAAGVVTVLVAGLALAGALPPLTFALASFGLLLATVAVRERALVYAYAAGAAFVGAALCQLADWGLSEPQWYVVPAGLYLLALADGLRRFQGRRRASQLIEAAAVALLLGVTFGQAVRAEAGPAYSLLLFGESLAVAGYGALVRLRAPFVGGVAFFVAGVTWMTVDAVRLANQWVLLGGVGLLMVLAYVVLERHQERLVRAGRRWVAQLQSWG